MEDKLTFQIIMMVSEEEKSESESSSEESGKIRLPFGRPKSNQRPPEKEKKI